MKNKYLTITPWEYNVPAVALQGARAMYDRVVHKYHHRLMPTGGEDLGAVLVHTPGHGYLCSPRVPVGNFLTSGPSFMNYLAGGEHTVQVLVGTAEPDHNAPLLAEFAAQFNHTVVVHFHEYMPGLPSMPSESVLNALRAFTEDMRYGFNIEGHGCVFPFIQP